VIKVDMVILASFVVEEEGEILVFFPRVRGAAWVRGPDLLRADSSCFGIGFFERDINELWKWVALV
jgi:hypothetical protein